LNGDRWGESINAMNSSELVSRALKVGLKKENSKAIGYLESAFNKTPDSVDVNFQLALAYREAGRFNEARECARRVLKLNPREPNARLNLGVIEADLGNEALAIRNYNLELKRNPQCFEAHYNLGMVYITRHQWVKAQGHLEKCWRAGHKGHLLREYLSLAAIYTGDEDLEEEIYLSRLKKQPRDFAALLNFGVLKRHQKRLEEAKELLEAALAVRPNNRKVKNNLLLIANDIGSSVKTGDTGN
jgi:tetratricopeptide (TPR) repeat protein